MAEMIAAVAITAILASVLSMMVLPVLRAYNSNRTKSELSAAVTSRLNDIAYHLRGATGVYLSSSTMSFPEIRRGTTDQKNQYDGMRYFEAKYGIALDNYYEKNSPKIKGYLYPEMKIVDYSDVNNPWMNYCGSFGLKLESDDYQSPYISCTGKEEGLYFYVRQNPDNGNSATVLEVHMTVAKNGITYSGTKTIVCENLVITGDIIYTAYFTKSGSIFTRTAATVCTGTNTSSWKKYYSVWFSKRI